MRRSLVKNRMLAIGVAATLAVTGIVPGLAVERAEAAGLVPVQLVSITDFHGYLQPPSPASGGTIPDGNGQTLTVGGAAYIAAHVKQIRDGHQNSIVFSDGDNYSGWPFEVAAYKDEPTIEFLNQLGVRFSSVGNHELDRSASFLVDHMENGTCFGTPGVDSCFTDSTGRRFHGSDFDYQSANLFDTDGNRIVAPYHIETIRQPGGKSLRVGFIGATTQTTPGGSTSFQPGLRTEDIVQSVNEAAAKLTRRKVNAIVLNMHEGGTDDSATFNDCINPHGPAIDIATQVSSAVDVIVTGHWHAAFNCMMNDPDGNPRPVVEAANHGRLLSEINLSLDPKTGDVMRDRTTSTNHPVTRDVTPDPATQKIVDYWAAKGQALAQEPVATTTGDFDRTYNEAGESTVADLFADAEYWDSQRTAAGAGDFALMVGKPAKGTTTAARGDLLYADSGKPGDADGRVTFEEAWEAFGYGNPTLTVSLTGTQIEQILEEQWQTQPDGSVKFAPLSVSANMSITWDPEKPVGDRVEPSDVMINSEPLDLSATYRVVALAYTVLGSDGFTGFTGYTDAVRNGRGNDHEMFMDYLRAHPALSPAPLTRVQMKSPTPEGSN